MIHILIGPFALLLSLSTSAGIFLHETKIDKLAILAMVAPVVAAQKVASGGVLETMPHTHSEAGVLEASSREFRSKSPGMTPRRDRDEKHRLGKRVPRGFYLFDSYHLPLERITA